MAGLTTLAFLAASAATSIAKTRQEYVGERSAAKAAENEGQFASDQHLRNAGFLDQQAADAVARGEEQAGDVSRQSRVTVGAQRAAFAGQGVNAFTGSAGDVVASDRATAALDRSRIQLNAKRAAWGFNVKADDERQQAGFALTAGKNRADSLRAAGTGTLLGGAADLLNIYQASPFGVGRSAPSSTSGFSAAPIARPIARGDGWMNG